ncbi:MAG: hypothetical protein K0U98_11960 [Deltaproteobacteria bacterium]|nr:hypothetical protein [Deltaproteobacteria bacterium]
MHRKIMGGLAALFLAFPMATLAHASVHQEAATPLAFFMDLLALGEDSTDQDPGDHGRAASPDSWPVVEKGSSRDMGGATAPNGRDPAEEDSGDRGGATDPDG